MKRNADGQIISAKNKYSQKECVQVVQCQELKFSICHKKCSQKEYVQVVQEEELKIANELYLKWHLLFLQEQGGG
jgi:hypothetical protein